MGTRARRNHPRRTSSRVSGVADSTAPRIRTGRVYDVPGRRDGVRVLIMRLWPRGIRKARVDRWLKDLGPSLPLLRAFRRGDLGWAEYRRRYLAGLASPAAQAAWDEVRALARRRPVTFLCGCADVARCHRTLLRAYAAKRVV